MRVESPFTSTSLRVRLMCRVDPSRDERARRSRERNLALKQVAWLRNSLRNYHPRTERRHSMWPSSNFQLFLNGFALTAIGAMLILSAMLSIDRVARIGVLISGLGAGVAALGIAAFLNPIQGVAAREIFGIWMVSSGMLFAATVILAQSRSRMRRVFVVCSVACLMLNAWAVAVLLWVAAVSAGGV